MDHDQYDHSFYDYAPTLAFDSFLNEEITGEAFGRFPSQSPPVERPTTKKKNKEKREPDNNISASGSTVLSESQKEQTEKEASNKKPAARVRKASADPSMPKRPVGRPRLYPAKPMDPNKPKRVAEGDRPVGRPRTKPLDLGPKRPRGRPRKISFLPGALGVAHTLSAHSNSSAHTLSANSSSSTGAIASTATTVTATEGKQLATATNGASITRANITTSAKAWYVKSVPSVAAVHAASAGVVLRPGPVVTTAPLSNVARGTTMPPATFTASALSDMLLESKDMYRSSSTAPVATNGVKRPASTMEGAN